MSNNGGVSYNPHCYSRVLEPVLSPGDSGNLLSACVASAHPGVDKVSRLPSAPSRPILVQEPDALKLQCASLINSSDAGSL